MFLDRDDSALALDFETRMACKQTREMFVLSTAAADLTSSLSFQHLWRPRRAAKHLPGRGAALPAGGHHRGDPEELQLLLLLHPLLHGSLRLQQGPSRQRRVRLRPQLLMSTPRPRAFSGARRAHTQEDQGMFQQLLCWDITAQVWVKNLKLN